MTSVLVAHNITDGIVMRPRLFSRVLLSLGMARSLARSSRLCPESYACNPMLCSLGTRVPPASGSRSSVSIPFSICEGAEADTACITANQQLMVQRFTKVMAKMAVLGQDARKLTDCSEVIPVPKSAASKVAHLPAGKTLKDIEQACKATPFPVIKADPGKYYWATISMECI